MSTPRSGFRRGVIEVSVIYAIVSLTLVNAASHPLSTQWLNTVHHHHVHSAPHHRRHLLNCAEGCSQGSLGGPLGGQPAPTPVPVKLPGVKLAMLRKGERQPLEKFSLWCLCVTCGPDRDVAGTDADTEFDWVKDLSVATDAYVAEDSDPEARTVPSTDPSSQPGPAPSQ